MNISTNRDIKTSAIILAAGSSRRFNVEIPKQYLKINNREVIDYSIQAFKSVGEIDEIVLVVSEQYLDKVKKKYPECKVVVGGKNRKESSYKGLLACCKNTNKVLIHDSARIFIDSNLIKNCVKALNDFDAVTLGIPCIDTIAKCNDFDIEEIEDRNKQFSIQTPQGFIYKKIKSAHEKFNQDATDDIKIMLKAGYKCKLIPGNKKNLKITHKEDIILAKSLFNEN